MVVSNIFFMFTPKIGEMMEQNDEHIFQMGWFNHQLVYNIYICCELFFFQDVLFSEKNMFIEVLIRAIDLSQPFR